MVARVDEIRDDVSELKAESKVQRQMVTSLRDDFKEHTNLIREHVAGDTKIIKEIQPFFENIGDLKEILSDYQFKKEIKRRKLEKLKYWSSRIGLVGGVIAIIGAFLKLF